MKSKRHDLAPSLLKRVVMKPLGVLAIVMGVTLVPAAARADEGFYGGMGAGTALSVEGDLEAKYGSTGQVAGRFIGGKRIGAFAVEGGFFGTDLTEVNTSSTASTFSLGLALKGFVPLGESVEGYAKAGLSKTWLVQTLGNEDGYDGRSYEWGFGVQYTVRTPVLQIGIFLDYTRQTMRLYGGENPRDPMDGRLGMVTFGFALGRAL